MAKRWRVLRRRKARKANEPLITQPNVSVHYFNDYQRYDGPDGDEDERHNRFLRYRIEEEKEYMNLNYDREYWDDADDGFTDEDAIENLMDECGQDRSGSCSLAGTEYCDFECPFRDDDDED